MANVTLQSFNVFLTERLTAAAVDIYGFVERTVLDYQEEVNRAKLENQRLQRLLDLVYQPEIRLHRTDSRQIDLSAWKQEVCAQEQQIQKECIPTEASEEPVILPLKEELTEPWTRSVETPEHPASTSIADQTGGHEENETPANLTDVVKGEEHRENGWEDSVGENTEFEIPCQGDQSLPFRESPLHAKKKSMFFCNICHQAFLERVELKLHLAAHAQRISTNKMFPCFVCGRVTDSRSQMICHMRTHTGEKPFVCPTCGNSYRLKGHIKEHMRTHTGERPYSCYICGKSFNRSSTMSKHARTKHRENMPFKCLQCSQRFSLLVLFKQHMKRVHDVTFSV